MAIQDKRRLIFVDEVVFSRTSLLRRAYSHRGENAVADITVAPAGYMSVIAGISYERGKELIEVQEEAVDANDFSEYIMGLSEMHGNRKVAIFIDNLSVHHVPVVV